MKISGSISKKVKRKLRLRRKFGFIIKLCINVPFHFVLQRILRGHACARRPQDQVRFKLSDLGRDLFH